MTKIIAIEGADRVGKHTQAKKLVHAIEEHGCRVALHEVPVRMPLVHSLIYRMLRTGSAGRYPNVFQFIQFTNKFIAQFTTILWSVLTCKYVVLDRWSASQVVYGNASGANALFTRFLTALLFRPTFTLIIDGATYKRIESPDTYESDNELQSSVKRGYISYANRNCTDTIVVTNRGNIEETHENIMNIIKEVQ
jgi:thymidylate kinase